MEATRTFTTGDGVRIAYRLMRQGAPRRTLVLIHGLASNLTRWSEFAATTRLAESWDVLRLDLRGHGGSLYRGRVGMQVWCDDLAALLDAANVPQAVLVGHCLGANLALWFAHRAPERVAGLVLIEPMFRQALAGTLARAAAWRPLCAALVPLLTTLAALGLHRRRLAPLDLAELDRAARAAMATSGGAFPQARYASPLDDLRSLPTGVYLQDFIAVTGPLPELTSLPAPVLALLSAGGTFSNPETTAGLLTALPDCRVERIAAQHWIPTEQPLAMRTAIEDWCETVLESSGSPPSVPQQKARGEQQQGKQQQGQ
ncbi:MAG: alpha/beta fold hydrolase [Rhodocyclaceae bacterium]